MVYFPEINCLHFMKIHFILENFMKIISANRILDNFMKMKSSNEFGKFHEEVLIMISEDFHEETLIFNSR